MYFSYLISTKSEVEITFHLSFIKFNILSVLPFWSYFIKTMTMTKYLVDRFGNYFANSKEILP